MHDRFARFLVGLGLGMTACTRSSSVDVPAGAPAHTVEAPASTVQRADAQTAPLACDPQAAPGDVADPSGRFICQLSLDGAVQAAFPCDVVATTDRGKRAHQMRLVKNDLRCYAEGMITGGNVKDGYVSCFMPNDERVVLMFDAPLTSISGGYRVEARAHDAAFREVPKPPMAVVLVACRKAWPPGFVSDFDRP